MKSVGECALKVSIGKTETKGVTKASGRLSVNMRMSDEDIKQVSTFRYLSSLMEENSKCDTEIKSRIGMAEANFGKIRGSLTCS